MKLLFRQLILAAGYGLFLTGCSTVVNSHTQKAPMMASYAAGDNSAVMDVISGKLKEPRWYNTSVVNTGDEVMWRLEAGSMNFHLGNFAESVNQFKKAEELIRAYDERASISVRDAGAEAGTAVTNLNTLPYRGFCRDRIALSIYKSLAYLGMDNESAFRAQLRRMRREQKKVQEDYQAFFDAQKAELEAAAKKNPKAAEQAEKQKANGKSENYPENTEFAEGMKNVVAVANKGYGNFLNPAAIFLSGLGSIRDENYDNARIDFKHLYEAMPGNPMIRQYYVTILQAAGRPVPKKLRNVQPFRFPLDRDCVYVLFANGISAAFKQIAVYFPVMTAWPMCEFYPAPFDKLTVKADGAEYSSLILADMDGILAQEFHERLPGMIARIVLSTLIKDGAYYGGLAVIGSSGMDSVSKGLTMGAVAVGGAGYRALMNTADTRTWELLPKEFQLTQFPMPDDRNLKITLGGRITRELKIPDGCRSAIIFVNAPGERNIAYHVLPIKSK